VYSVRTIDEFQLLTPLLEHDNIISFTLRYTGSSDSLTSCTIPEIAAPILDADDKLTSAEKGEVTQLTTPFGHLPLFLARPLPKLIADRWLEIVLWVSTSFLAWWAMVRFHQSCFA
jgi:hypothetical protein